VLRDAYQPTRRRFLQFASAIPLMGSRLTATVSEAVGPNNITDFQNSYLCCEPKGTGIWVRSQLECICSAFDTASYQSQKYYLSVKAQTGLGKTSIPGQLHPGYEYWMIFLQDRVFMKRLHTSSYLNNPSEVLSDDFGPMGSQIQTRAGRRLTGYAEIKDALKGWHSLTARTTFFSRDRKRAFRVEYPVKWADVNEGQKQFRVETGPVLLLDPEKIRNGSTPSFEHFQWAHLDYHSFDSARCLLERPTAILEDACYQPPESTPRETAGLSSEQVGAIERRLFDGWDPPLDFPALRKLLSTDRYSDAVDRGCLTEIYALGEPDTKKG
jgi:hypothetical protein